MQERLQRVGSRGEEVVAAFVVERRDSGFAPSIT